jgi:hypothetical protein
LQALAHQALDFTLNARVLGFSLGIAAISVIVFGLVPAVRATRVDVCASLKSASRGSPDPRRRRLSKLLVAGQVASALVLLLGAGLLLRTFVNVSAIDTGVPTDRMLTMRIALSQRETQQRLAAGIVYTDIARRVGALPGVESAALGWDFSLGSGSAGKSVWVEGQPPDRSQSAGFNVVGPGFFSTVGIPIVAGREFSPSDTLGARKVAIVNEAFARLYFGRRSAVGGHVGDEGAASIGKYEVIGVVRDARTMRLRNPPGPMIYQPLLQDEWASNVVLHVRTGTTRGG